MSFQKFFQVFFSFLFIIKWTTHFIFVTIFKTSTSIRVQRYHRQVFQTQMAYQWVLPCSDSCWLVFVIAKGWVHSASHQRRGESLARTLTFTSRYIDNVVYSLALYFTLIFWYEGSGTSSRTVDSFKSVLLGRLDGRRKAAVGPVSLTLYYIVLDCHVLSWSFWNVRRLATSRLPSESNPHV